jgi:hypothetical protein
MEILLFRTALAPCLVLLVSVVARRLGPRLGGRLLGAPTTSGPFLAILCLGSGADAAAHAAHGSVAGQLSVAVFSFTYGRLAPRFRPALTLTLSLACVAIAGAVEVLCGDDIAITANLALLLILVNVPAPVHEAVPALMSALMSADVSADVSSHVSADVSVRASAPDPKPLSRRAIAARMALSGAVVLVSLNIAHVAGPFVGGMISAMPVLLAVMAPTLHRGSGPGAAIELLRGALAAAAGTIAFLLVLCVALVPCGPVAAFALALVALAVTDPLVSRATVLAKGNGTTDAGRRPPADRRASRRRPVYFVRIGLVSRQGRRSCADPAPTASCGASKPAARGGPGRPRRIQSADLFPGTRPTPPCPPGRWTR